MRLGGLTWPEVEGHAPVLLLPVGATEQHGPHLPLETDTLIAEALAVAAAERCPDAMVAPALPYASSGEHAGFPGTLSIGREALEFALVELVRSADAFALVVAVCWHGGNGDALTRAAARVCSEGRRLAVWHPAVPEADLHAGRTETSLMLALAPELVRRARPQGARGSLRELMPALRAEGVRAVDATGVLGDATGAGAAEGRALLQRLTEDLVAFVNAHGAT